MAFPQGSESRKKKRNDSYGFLKVLLVIPADLLFVPLSPLPLLIRSLGLWILDIAGQLSPLVLFVKKWVKCLSLCVSLFPKLKPIDYRASFSSSKYRQRFDKVACCDLPVGHTSKTWFSITVCVCGCLAALNPHVTEALFNAHAGRTVAWPICLGLCLL